MEIFVLKSDEVAAITRGTHGNPHHILVCTSVLMTAM